MQKPLEYLPSSITSTFVVHWAFVLYKVENIFLHRYIGKRGHGHRTMDAGQRTPDKRWKRRTTMEKTDNDGKDGQRWKRRTTMEKTDKRWKRRTNDGKDGQTMEKMDKRWKRRTNDGKDGQTMEKTDKRWKRRTNDGKDGRVFSYI